MYTFNTKSGIITINDRTVFVDTYGKSSLMKSETWYELFPEDVALAVPTGGKLVKLVLFKAASRSKLERQIDSHFGRLARMAGPNKVKVTIMPVHYCTIFIYMIAACR